MKRVDISSKRFGKLVALKYIIPSEKKKRGIWECRCDCGELVHVPYSLLVSGRKKSCGCLLASLYYIRPRKEKMIGVKFGRLAPQVYLGNVPRKNGKLTQGKWRCLCECGNIVDVFGFKLRTGHTRSCGCLRDDTRRYADGEANLKSICHVYKKHAKEAGRKFSLTLDQCRVLFSSDCHYCGCPPRQKKKNDKNTGHFLYNGIDRIDNNLGYIFENCLPCCKTCNRAKYKMSYAEFLSWIARTFAHIQKTGIVIEA